MLGMVSSYIARHGKIESDCLNEQDGFQKCKPTDGIYCRPCLSKFKETGMLPNSIESSKL
jgi:hypothetical protein